MSRGNIETTAEGQSHTIRNGLANGHSNGHIMNGKLETNGHCNQKRDNVKIKDQVS